MIIVLGCRPSQRNRRIPWIDVFGEGADEEDQIDEIDDFVVKLHAYLVSFTTDAANRIVRNSGEGNGLKAWRRLRSEYDPTSSTRRVAILQQVQNSSRCQRVEDLGIALEDWPRRNVSARCSPTGTDGLARHQTTALWRPCSGSCQRAWRKLLCSRKRTKASRSCTTDCWPTAARSSQSQ